MFVVVVFGFILYFDLYFYVSLYENLLGLM